MRARRSAHDQVAEVARRRLEQLSAELAELRPDNGRTPGAHAAVPTERRTSGLEEPEPSPPGFRRPADPSGSREQTKTGRHLRRPVGPEGWRAGWLQDRLPPAFQGRWRLGLAHLVVVASVLLVALGLTGWWLARPESSGAPLPVVGTPASDLVPLARSPAVSQPPSASSASSAGSSGFAAPAPSGAPAASAAGGPGEPVAGGPPLGGAPSGRIVVDVAGKVRRPGIATLPAGSRVVDALRAAGGARRGVALGSLNLARVLTDGEQILVGVPTPPGVAASAASAPATGSGLAPAMVNINTGSEAELEELPGVGPVTAQAIVQYRAENGAFTSVDQLLEVSGIGEATLAKVAPFVTL